MRPIDDYTDYYGMIHTVPTGPAKEPSTNNSVGTTSLYYGLLQLNTAQDVSEFWLQHYDLMVQNNVLGRAQSHIQQGPDDYICFFFASSVLNFYAARNILMGQSKYTPGLYYWNNSGSFNLAALFCRFPGLIAQGKIASYAPNGEVKLNWFNKLMFAASLFLAARKAFSVQDSWMQSDMMVKTYLSRIKIAKMPRSWIIDKAIAYWTKKKGTKKIKDIFIDYAGNADHPLATIWIENEEAFK